MLVKFSVTICLKLQKKAVEITATKNPVSKSM